MKLYRGYKQRPKILNQALAEELKQLNAVAKSGPEGETIVEAIHRMGGDEFVRHVELRQIAGPQFFTNDEQVARTFAGPEGFVIEMDVPPEEADVHYQGEQSMRSGEDTAYSSNYVFLGTEIADKLSEWKVDLIELGVENLEAAQEIEKPRIDRTVRGSDELSPQDKAAINDLRDHFGKPRLR